MSDPIFPLEVWQSGTNENSIPANDNALRVEAMSRKVISKTTTAQPGAPADGDTYIIPGAATGVQWATFVEDDIAIYRGGTWYAWAPVTGLVLEVAGALEHYDGSDWTGIGGGDAADVSIADAGGYFTATNVEGALQELGAAGGAGAVEPMRPVQFVANSNAVPTLVGMGVAYMGTNLNNAPASTNVYTSQRRYTARAAASGTAIAGFYNSNSHWVWRGNAAMLGGFDVKFRWGAGEGVTNTSCRCFVGLDAATGVSTDVNPSTLTSIVGMGWDSADTNIQVMHNDGSGTATKVDLGANFPVPTSDSTEVYELRLRADPNGSTIVYTAIRLSTGDEATGTLSTDLPPSATFLGPRGWISAGGVSTQTSFALMYFGYADGEN